MSYSMERDQPKKVYRMKGAAPAEPQKMPSPPKHNLPKARNESNKQKEGK